jgi:hypothetical protein
MGSLVTSKSIFTRWLRSKQLPILLSCILIVISALQSLDDQLSHEALGSPSTCKYYLLIQSVEGGIVPLAIRLPSDLIDQAPAIGVLLVLPLTRILFQV